MSDSLTELIAQRRAKLAAARAGGEASYPSRFDGVTPAADLLGRYAGLFFGGHEPSVSVTVAGRLMTRRDMGKSVFAHLQDLSGRVQIYLKKDVLGEAFAAFVDRADLGDLIGVQGSPMRTRTGEISLQVASWRLLAKALRPPPEKFHGMTDPDARFRRREVDLFSNEGSRRRFLQRHRIVQALRRVLDEKTLMEVETPVLQAVPGGAAARPFTSHHEALDMGLYLRIAPELFLKRLLVGGLERVYEIGRAFRNEGIDTRHNPEFTILEAYQAYTDVRGMMDLTEELIRSAARAVRADEGHGMLFTHRGREVDLSRPFERLALEDLFRRNADLDYAELCRAGDWRRAARSLHLPAPDEWPEHRCFDLILDEKILPSLPPAAFVHGYPAAFSPLAKQAADRPEIAERFELFLAGEEIANAYSEQNDPDIQRRHFQAQARARQAGDAEAMPADEEFLIALEHGMPPAGGLGIGVDRLTMILTGTDSIREVILFPLLRPTQKGTELTN